ncbi:MAG: glutathione S-transferase family protein [bacterium]
MIKLYGVPQSRAIRPIWMLHELGLEFENVPTHLSNTHTAEFLKLNPNGHIPVLVDGEVVLWESLAINLYLARRYGGGTLWPATVEDEGRTFQWSIWSMTEVEPNLLPVLMHRRALPKEQRQAEIADAAEAKLAGPLGVLEGALRGRQYLLGNAFGAADLNAASVLSWATVSGVDLSKTPQLADWLTRCTDRPAYKAARG